MRHFSTTDCTDYSRFGIWRIALLLAIFNCQLSLVNPAKAQSETDAFYIYQNDGHFDGFFYDDVIKITYSRLDTLGFEHSDYISQEIVTADSTYRIMLAAIDSVGFVQPEVKYNPRLRLVSEDQLFTKMLSHDAEYENLVFAGSTPDNLKPKVGDVFASFDVDDGWSGKVTEVKASGGNIAVTCSPIDDITDIFERFVMVEQYDGNRQGQLIRRRVAGRPDLTINADAYARQDGDVAPYQRHAPNRAEGTWEGDLFNFSISGHIPLYAGDALNITLDPSIEGKLHLKTAWNLSLWGDKYIGITSQLDFGVGLGFTVDGQIKDFFPSGVGGLLGGVPIPATCPLLYLDIAPDGFIRGDAHVKFSAQAPKLKGGMWSKLEVNNWWPTMSIGLGNPDGNANWETWDDDDAGLSLELNGYVQAGMLFPMKFKSLPVLKKFFAADIGGQWFVGPKLSGAVALDLLNMPWNDTGTYTLMNNTKLSLHLIDADFEVKGTIKTAFSGKKEVTLADGSISLFPPLDAAIVPEFNTCKESADSRYFHKKDQESWSAAPDELDGTKQPCRVFAFEPAGAVLSPVTTGTALYKKNEAGEYELVEMQRWDQSYYHLFQMLGQDVPKEMWPQFILWDKEDLSPYADGAYKVYPTVHVFGKDWLAEPAYEFNLGEDPQAAVTHHPSFVHHFFKMGGYAYGDPDDYCMNHLPEDDGGTDGVYFADWYEDITDVMKQVNVTPNDGGGIFFFKDGLNMTGSYDKDKNEGEGTFTLTSAYHKEVMTLEQVEYYFSSATGYVEYLIKNNSVFNLMMYGDIQHNIEGTFTVKKVGANYVYTFEGQGPYNLDCTALDGVLNLDWLSPLYTLPTEINTFDLQQTGNTWMQYEVRVKAQ